MKIVIFSVLVVLSSGITTAAELWLVRMDQAEISINENNGTIVVHKLGNIALKTKQEIARDVFSHIQMAKSEPPKIRWRTLQSQNMKVVLETVLTKEIAGIDLDGVVLTKTIEYRMETSQIAVTLHYQNNTAETRYVSSGVQNILCMYANEHEPVYVPTESGVLPITPGMFLNFYSTPGPWFTTPTESWIARINPERKVGITFNTDYNVLGSLFIDGKKNIFGFMFDGGYLGSGESASVAYSIRAIEGLSSIATVNDYFAAAIDSANERVVLSVYPFSSGTISGEGMLKSVGDKILGTSPFNIIVEKNVIGSYGFDTDTPRAQTVAKFSASFNTHSYDFEQYFENGFRTQNIPSCAYSCKIPRRIPLKQEVKKWVGVVGAQRDKKAICFFGLYTNFHRLDAILENWTIDNYSVSKPVMKNIPPISTINEYSLMVISNAFIESLNLCLPRIESYVRNGGTLLVLGGSNAYGAGAYNRSSILDKMLPIDCVQFDLRPAAGDGIYNVGKVITGEGIAGNEFEIYWYHKYLTVRAGAEVLWTCGDHPILIRSRYGKGKVICYLGAPLGNPNADSNPFWNSQVFIDAMRKILLESVPGEAQ